MASSDEDLLQCYNKGCGVKFSKDNNDADSCCFHSGEPVFHDAYKGWSCCNKKSTDFTTFLQMKGCTIGEHNPVKPVEPAKEKPLYDKNEVITVTAPQNVSLPRPSFEAKLQPLQVVVTNSLKEALAKETESRLENDDEESHQSSIKVGDSCNNNGCNASFEAEFSNLDVCRHHPGYPVFHEGMKFWSCCVRKTSDFESFLQQEGCQSGSHLWTRPKLKSARCRYDWHQTATHVVVTVYAKMSRPDESRFEANPVRLEARLCLAEDHQFTFSEELGGIILVEQSCVTMSAAKVEVKMRKAEPKHWNKLFLPDKKDSEPKPRAPATDPVRDDGLSVEAIDLSDL